jgi:hypothetical protein
MEQPAQLIFRKLATLSFVLFAISAVSPTALARPKGVTLGFNHGDRDHHFLHGYRHFGVPYWWYADYGYRYDYVYDDPGPAYDDRYWQDLAMKVQLELARRGYYHGQINGVIDSRSRQAIRAFEKTQGLPETGLINPALLRSLRLAVPQVPARFS